MKGITCLVKEVEDGTKLVKFLDEMFDGRYSKRYLKHAIEANCCLINGKVERHASHSLSFGDEVIIDLEPLFRKINQEPSFDPEKVLYQDEDFLVYNKPAGIAVDGRNGLDSLLQSKFGTVGLAHRLDKDTSGALLLPKNHWAKDWLEGLFRKRKIKKTYLAIVDGIPHESKGEINNFLGARHRYQGQALYGAVSPQEGKRAVTRWKRLAEGDKSSLIECQPITGRTHQLRVHLFEMGHPILGDYQYCRDFLCMYRPTRQMLHAKKIAFPLPDQEGMVEIKAPLPADFTTTLDELGLSV